jgi:uncharacterized membrane protein
MPTVEQSIDVNVDISNAYDQWTRFDSFPQWMEGVVSVDRINDDRLHWVARVRSEFATVEGETREWDARVTELTRDQRVSWETIGGAPGRKPDSGAVSFEPLGDAGCRVSFLMSWEPEGDLETPDEVLVAVHQVLAADLGRFKELVETRGTHFGSQRGESVA